MVISQILIKESIFKVTAADNVSNNSQHRKIILLIYFANVLQNHMKITFFIFVFIPLKCLYYT